MECIVSKKLKALNELNKTLQVKLANIEEVYKLQISDSDKLKYIKSQIEQGKEADEYLKYQID